MACEPHYKAATSRFDSSGTPRGSANRKEAVRALVTEGCVAELHEVVIRQFGQKGYRIPAGVRRLALCGLACLASTPTHSTTVRAGLHDEEMALEFHEVSAPRRQVKEDATEKLEDVATRKFVRSGRRLSSEYREFAEDVLYQIS